jgi:hypothetical protein
VRKDKKMKIFEIVNCYGDVIEHVKANNERHALCIYLTTHEEFEDMMLWKTPAGMWKLAEYDCEEQYVFARKTYDF